jgi:hypothetical protein
MLVMCICLTHLGVKPHARDYVVGGCFPYGWQHCKLGPVADRVVLITSA